MDGQDAELDFSLLFKSVIKQAAKDAFLLHGSSLSTKKDKQNALKFLKGGRDLELACDIANVSYDKIIYWMRHLSDNNNLNYKQIEKEIK